MCREKRKRWIPVLSPFLTMSAKCLFLRSGLCGKGKKCPIIDTFRNVSYFDMCTVEPELFV